MAVALRSHLLQRNLHNRCLRAAHGRLKRDVAGAQTGRDCDIDLIQTSARFPRKTWRHAHILDAESHWVRCGRRAGKYSTRWNHGIGRSKPDAIKFYVTVQVVEAVFS